MHGLGNKAVVDYWRGRAAQAERMIDEKSEVGHAVAEEWRKRAGEAEAAYVDCVESHRRLNEDLEAAEAVLIDRAGVDGMTLVECAEALIRRVDQAEAGQRAMELIFEGETRRAQRAEEVAAELADALMRFADPGAESVGVRVDAALARWREMSGG